VQDFAWVSALSAPVSAKVLLSLTHWTVWLEATGNLRSNMIMGCAIAETTGIYSLIIAFLILFLL
jgi:hypothetical protein